MKLFSLSLHLRTCVTKVFVCFQILLRSRYSKQGRWPTTSVPVCRNTAKHHRNRLRPSNVIHDAHADAYGLRDSAATLWWPNELKHRNVRACVHSMFVTSAIDRLTVTSGSKSPIMFGEVLSPVTRDTLVVERQSASVEFESLQLSEMRCGPSITYSDTNRDSAVVFRPKAILKTGKCIK